MIYRWLLLLIRVPLFSAASSAVIVLAATGQPVVFPIESSDRGTEIYNTFNMLTHASGIQVPEVALQTSLPTQSYATYKYLINGIIPYVQAINQTTYNTLLIISYLPPQSQAVTQYIVLPVEEVIAFLYFPQRYNLPTSTAPFTSTYKSGTIPFYSVDPKQRAIDIVSAVTTLSAKPFQSGLSQVWIQTTLNGPFYPPITNGLLKNVIAISVDSSLIQIQYQPTQPSGLQVQTIIVAPEQVQQIIYVLYPNAP